MSVFHLQFSAEGDGLLSFYLGISLHPSRCSQPIAKS